AAADRDHDAIEVGNILQHLAGDSALAGHDAFVVIWVDQRQLALDLDALAARLRFRYALAVKHDFGAMRFRGRYFDERRRHWHDDDRRNFEPRGVVCHRLRVIAGRHGDDAAPALGLVERGELDQRAAILERIG